LAVWAGVVAGGAAGVVAGGGVVVGGGVVTGTDGGAERA
jgi:hypothetical protein